jgi:hypothetical protein
MSWWGCEWCPVIGVKEVFVALVLLGSGEGWLWRTRAAPCWVQRVRMRVHYCNACVVVSSNCNDCEYPRLRPHPGCPGGGAALCVSANRLPRGWSLAEEAVKVKEGWRRWGLVVELSGVRGRGANVRSGGTDVRRVVPSHG